MKHIETLKKFDSGVSNELIKKATGQYYTHFAVAKHLILGIIKEISKTAESKSEFRIVDPFAGDGRLVDWLIREWNDAGLPKVIWYIELWDINGTGLESAQRKMDELRKLNVEISFEIKNVDAFKISQETKNTFDIVITNPPWELLKPDSRELKELNPESRKEYIDSIKNYDFHLNFNFPLAQPTKKFAGWGTNLSRVGLELSHSICKAAGIVGIVIPASFFADDQSIRLRSEIFNNYTVCDIGYFPAEAKVFGTADVNAATFIYKKVLQKSTEVYISTYNAHLKLENANNVAFTLNPHYSETAIVAVGGGVESNEILNKMGTGMVTWGAIEKKKDGLWAGREIDETGRANWLSLTPSGPGFVKGDMITRFGILKELQFYVKKENWSPPVSSKYERIGWRDVSRTSQKRRVIAAIIPSGTVCGNSLNVAHFKDGNGQALRALLAIVNSLCFEFQLRQYLGTGHISLSSVRKVFIPSKEELLNNVELYTAICLLEKNQIEESYIEALVAKKVYRLTIDEFEIVINTFKKITEVERINMLSEYTKCS